MKEQMIKDLIHKLIKKHDSTNPFEICEQLGINIEYEDLGNYNGYYICVNRVKQIRVNVRLDDKMKRWACAHELGHALMHPNVNTFFLSQNTYTVTNKFEIEANLFADTLIDVDSDIHIC